MFKRWVAATICVAMVFGSFPVYAEEQSAINSQAATESAEDSSVEEEVTDGKSVLEETKEVTSEEDGALEIQEQKEENIPVTSNIEEPQMEVNAESASVKSSYGSKIDTGNCGANAMWISYDNDGNGLGETIVIDGDGFINEDAFENNEEIRTHTKELILGNGIRKIGKSAFQNWGNLIKATLPNSLTDIGSYSFYGCGNLTTVNLPDNLVSIESNAFERCYKLHNVKFPYTLQNIGYGAFRECNSFDKIIIPKDVKLGERVFAQCANLKTAGSAGTGSNIEFELELEVPENAFDGTYISSVKLSDKITNIGAKAFRDCIRLKEIDLPDEIKVLGNSCFSGAGLQSVDLKNTAILDGHNFADCKNLSRIIMSDKLNAIWAETFKNCINLTKIEIPDTITTIMEDAFDNSPVTLYGLKGSYAEAYAKENRIPFKETGIPVTGFNFSNPKITVYLGENVAVPITVTPANHTAKSSPVYEISNQGTIELYTDENGDLYATGLNVGTVTITANWFGKSAICEVEVIKNINPSVAGEANLQTYGWENYGTNVGMIGTTGQSKRLEAIKLSLSGIDVEDGGIQYQSHIQDIGWQNWVKDGAVSGTAGQYKQMEAIRIRLYGEVASKYDIYYRVHAQHFGWLGWAKNGELAGTAAYNYRLEALEIQLVEKGGKAPGSTGNSFKQKNFVKYQTHIQDIGWQNAKYDGALGGTTGQYKRMEGIVMHLVSAPYSGGIQYQAHIQDIGWQGWKQDGVLAGTTGQSKRLEAIQIKLTGEMAQHYDVYYRAHTQTYGWLGWAKNGAKAGTEGLSKRMEGIEIRIVPKGGAAPGSTSGSFKEETKPQNIVYQAHMQTYCWLDEVMNGATGGVTGQYKRMEALKIKIQNPKYSGGVQYRAHLQTTGWQGWKSNGEMAGTTGQYRRMEAVQIKLTGKMAEKYDIYYRAHVQTYGWLGWTKNGAKAGTEGLSKRMEGIQIQLVPKGGKAPGNTANCFYKK